jgi:aryl-alcohol dehydrogenase-like predicted oxidoreductase
MTGAIVGIRNADQVAGIIGAMDFRLTPEEVAEVAAV